MIPNGSTFNSQTIYWHPKEEKPLEYGDYMVLGLRTSVPDHDGQPDSVWKIMTASYTVFGWSTKIKCWATKPVLPKKYRKYLGKVTYFNRVRW